MDNREVAHLWANQSRSRASGSHFYFEGDTIYSYGSHFPIARHYKGVVLFTTKRHSVTTAKHKSYVFGACHHLPVFHVSSVMDNPRGQDVLEYAEQIKGACESVARQRVPSLETVERVIKEANDFCERFGFKTRFTMPDNWDELREKAKAGQAKARKAKAEKQARFEASCAEYVQQWINGEHVNIPHGYSKTLLRVKHLDIDGRILKAGDAKTWTRQLETSRGALVPLDEAQKAFRFCMIARARGWHRNGDQFKVGDYQLDAVNEQGVVAGCHRIAWNEIERFAKTQGWL